MAKIGRTSGSLFWYWNNLPFLLEETLLGSQAAVGAWSERSWESDSTSIRRAIEGSRSPQPLCHVWLAPTSTKPHILWHVCEPDTGDCAECKGAPSHGDVSRASKGPLSSSFPQCVSKPWWFWGCLLYQCHLYPNPAHIHHFVVKPLCPWPYPENPLGFPHLHTYLPWTTDSLATRWR